MSRLVSAKSEAPLIDRLLIFVGVLLLILNVFWCAIYWIVATRPVQESVSFGGVDSFVQTFVYVMIPLFIVSTLMVAVGVQLVLNHSRRHGRCRKCGYDRRADTGINCPECGYAEEESLETPM